MAYLAKNNARSTLDAPLGGTIADVTLQIDAGDEALFPTVNQGGVGSDFTFLTLEDSAANKEIVKVTRKDAGAATMTVERAQEGTTARAWQIGDSISLRLTAGVVTQTYAHPWDNDDAHPASAITVTPAGNITANNAQSALQELDTKKANASHNQAATTITVAAHAPSGLASGTTQSVLQTHSAHVTAASAAHAASAISVVPVGDIEATNVQAALAELDATDAGLIDQMTALAQAAVPLGTIAPFAMSTPPSGWLECNGAAVSRTTYADLFTKIGTTWGTGDGSTTFNLPDLRGEFLRGWDNGRGVDAGRTFASSQGFAMQNITGTFYAGNRNGVAPTGAFTLTGNTANNSYSGGGSAGDNRETAFDISGSASTANETRPRNVAIIFCIKATGGTLDAGGGGGGGGGAGSDYLLDIGPAGGPRDLGALVVAGDAQMSGTDALAQALLAELNASTNDETFATIETRSFHGDDQHPGAGSPCIVRVYQSGVTTYYVPAGYEAATPTWLEDLRKAEQYVRIAGYNPQKALEPLRAVQTWKVEDAAGDPSGTFGGSDCFPSVQIEMANDGSGLVTAGITGTGLRDMPGCATAADYTIVGLMARNTAPWMASWNYSVGPGLNNDHTMNTTISRTSEGVYELTFDPLQAPNSSFFVQHLTDDSRISMQVSSKGQDGCTLTFRDATDTLTDPASVMVMAFYPTLSDYSNFGIWVSGV